MDLYGRLTEALEFVKKECTPNPILLVLSGDYNINKFQAIIIAEQLQQLKMLTLKDAGHSNMVHCIGLKVLVICCRSRDIETWMNATYPCLEILAFLGVRNQMRFSW